MEKYVVSRELAERLAAAGYDQEDTMFMWTLGLNGKYGIQSFAHITPLDMPTAFAAPLSDELLEQMKHLNRFDIATNGKVWQVRFMSKPDPTRANIPQWIAKEADKPADALAELWLWCKEQGYIK